MSGMESLLQHGCNMAAAISLSALPRKILKLLYIIREAQTAGKDWPIFAA
jgi:hypothetical protein